MEYKLDTVALHITNDCEHKCPMCYATCENQTTREGNFKDLKLIMETFQKAGVKEINLAGGNPAKHSHIEEIIKYGYDLGLDMSVLSNTHNYKNSRVERIAPYVSSLEWTVHGPTAKIHDAFCGKNAFEETLHNMQTYDAMRDENQKLGIVMNLMSHNYNLFYDTISNLLERGLEIDYLLIQRIAPFYNGKNFENNLTIEQVIEGFKNIKMINKELGVESVICDAFPFCKIPRDLHPYLAKCDWGYNITACDMDGNLSRCAMSSKYTLGNVLKENPLEIWNHSEILKKFRSKEYLPDSCQTCDTLEKCGGGCAMSCGNENLSCDAFVKKIK